MTDTAGSLLPDVRNWSWTGIAKVAVFGLVVAAFGAGYKFSDEMYSMFKTQPVITDYVRTAEFKALVAKVDGVASDVAKSPKTVSVSEFEELSERVKALEKKRK